MAGLPRVPLLWRVAEFNAVCFCVARCPRLPLAALHWYILLVDCNVAQYIVLSRCFCKNLISKLRCTFSANLISRLSYVIMSRR